MRRRVVKISSISRLIPRLLHRNVNPQESQPEISSTRKEKRKKKKRQRRRQQMNYNFQSSICSLVISPLSVIYTRAHTRGHRHGPLSAGPLHASPGEAQGLGARWTRRARGQESSSD